jgi:hypothetical protein
MMLATFSKDLDRAEQCASVSADNLRSYVRGSDPFRYWEADSVLAIGSMVVIISNTESEEHIAALYQEAEGLAMRSGARSTLTRIVLR